MIADDLIPLEADCGRCFSLCCLAPAFDASEDFAADKPARTPCPHLDGHRCGIHTDLIPRGYRGCVAYTCHGAGQAVSERLLGGQSWLDDPALVDVAADAFMRLRVLHELLAMVKASADLPLDDDARVPVTALAHTLRAHASADLATLQTLDVDAVAREARQTLRGLRAHLPRPAGGLRIVSDRSS